MNTLLYISTKYSLLFSIAIPTRIIFGKGKGKVYFTIQFITLHGSY